MRWEGTKIFLPQHSLSRETLLSVLQRVGRWLEVDPMQGVRLASAAADMPVVTMAPQQTQGGT